MSGTVIASYLAAEALIVARLQERVRDVYEPRLHVLTAASVQATREGEQPTPAVQVVYYGDSRVQAQAQGARSQVQQTWLAVVCVRNVAEVRRGGPAREDAGLLGVHVCRALMGWAPGDGAGYSRLEQVQSPYRATYTAGRLYLPLAFTLGFELRKNDA